MGQSFVYDTAFPREFDISPSNPGGLILRLTAVDPKGSLSDSKTLRAVLTAAAVQWISNNVVALTASGTFAGDAAMLTQASTTSRGTNARQGDGFTGMTLNVAGKYCEFTTPAIGDVDTSTEFEVEVPYLFAH